MKKIFALVGAVLAIYWAGYASAAVVTEQLTIKKLAPYAGGWMVAFSTAPQACTGGGYNGFHARFVEGEDPNLMTDLMVARNLQVEMSVKLDTAENCSASLGVNGLLLILDVE